MFIWLIKIILFLLSFSGYVFLIHFLSPKFKREFIPIVIVSVLTLILFIAELVGIGYLCINVLYFGGFIILLYGITLLLCKRIRYDRFCFFDKSILILLCLFFLFCVLLYGRKFEWWDSYSHWGIIVRRILTYNHLPDGTDRSIQYVSYPPGMSLFIYYFCSFVDGNDYSMSSCQLFVTLVSLYSFFAFLSNKKWPYYFCFTIILMVLMLSDYAVSDIMVDEQLATVAASGSLIILYYRKEEDLKRYIGYISFIVVFEALIKSSGLFFSLLIAVYYMVNVKEKRYRGIIPFILSAISILAWTIRGKILFSELETSNHAVSVSRYLRIFNSRSSDEIKNFILLFTKSRIESYGIWLFIALVVISMFLFRNIKKDFDNSAVKKNLIFLTISYIVWLLLVLCMYIFSLEDGDIMELPSGGRYIATMEIYLEILLCAELVQLGCFDFLADIKNIAVNRNKVLLTIIYFFVFSRWAISFLVCYDLFPKGNIVSHEYRDLCYSILEDYPLQDNKRYLVYMGRNYDAHSIEYNGMLKDGESYIFQYVFNTPYFMFVNEEGFDQADKNDYDYLIIMRETTYPDKVFRENINIKYNVTDDVKLISLH